MWVLFDMGTDPVRIAWRRIANVHPVSHRAGKPPSARFLPSQPRSPMTQKEQLAVLKRIRGRWAGGVRREDGVVVPILLLGLDQALNIENEARTRLAVLGQRP